MRFLSNFRICMIFYLFLTLVSRFTFFCIQHLDTNIDPNPSIFLYSFLAPTGELYNLLCHRGLGGGLGGGGAAAAGGEEKNTFLLGIWILFI